MSMRRGRTRGERGGAALEFALIAPILLLLVFGIVDFGWMLMKANLVTTPPVTAPGWPVSPARTTRSTTVSTPR